MAYVTTNPPALIAQRVGAATGALWLYSSADAMTDVAATDYFTNAKDLGMVAGDAMIVVTTGGPTVQMAVVSAIDADGNGTVLPSISGTLSGGSQELTASGAVTAGVQYLNLNHASVVIAATIADAAAHAGIFVISDTSASGTAAHTVTLTAGTLNLAGNTVATLNAPGERLVVLFDAAGAGAILENTGGVALSGP